jgi:hypothetical protein
MSDSIDSTGDRCHSESVMTDPEVERIVASRKEEIDRELFAVLAFDPNAPACVGIVAVDGRVGIAKATTSEGYRRAPVPTVDMPERPLWEAVGVALERPRKPGTEHIVLVTHDEARKEVTVRAFAVETNVRDVIRSVLGEPKTPDERRVENLVRTMPAEANPGTTLEECVDTADLQVADFAKIVVSVMQGSTLREKGLTLSDNGRELVKWWNDPSRHAATSLRQQVLLVTLLRANLIAEAHWLKGFGETIKGVVLPPPNTPRNTEVLAMSAAVIVNAASRDSTFESEELFAGRYAAVEHLMRNARDAFEVAGLAEMGTYQFFRPWLASAFARLEVSHKLAAALCLTDVPSDTELHAPWEAWSLVVPDGLLGAAQPARIWCIGLEPKFVVTATAKIVAWSEEAVGGRAAAELLQSFVRAACVVLSDPDRREAKGKWGGASGTSAPARGKRTVGAPLEGARYLLAQPVTIDLRETVSEVLRGRRGGGGGIPKHQFLVRGHPRQQAWGPKHSLRRYKWIEPFWKGDPSARILLRGHKVEDGGSADPTA